MTFENSCKKKMLKGEPALAAWLSTGSPIAAEIVANAGYDAVIMDHEHGPGDFLNAISLMQAASESGATPMMRVPWNDTVYIKRALDIGVMGIVVPYVQNAAEAKAAVDACHYPTDGIRGVAPHAGRCSRWGARLKEYLDAWPKNLLLACQIETEEAVENIEEIAAVDGVDMLFLGPSDVSASIGHMLQLQEPAVIKLFERAERKMRATGKLMGTVIRPGKSLNWTFERGYDLVIGGGDVRLLQSAAVSQVTGFRENPPKSRKGTKAKPAKRKRR
jgi:2-keto-3-deoxy-L-rhamnonate aldolase RhmA